MKSLKKKIEKVKAQYTSSVSSGPGTRPLRMIAHDLNGAAY